jgi:hypothetical protein
MVTVFTVVLQQFREIQTNGLLSNKKKNYFNLINNNIVLYFNGIFLRNPYFHSTEPRGFTEFN